MSAKQARCLEQTLVEGYRMLKAGMPAETFVETGNRSILSFLIKPLLDQLRYSMRSEG